MSDDLSPVEQELQDANAELFKAVQRLASARAVDDGEPQPLVQVAIICWDEVSYNEDGDVQRRTSYSCPGDAWSRPTAVGMLDIVKYELLSGATWRAQP